MATYPKFKIVCRGRREGRERTGKRKGKRGDGRREGK